MPPPFEPIREGIPNLASGHPDDCPYHGYRHDPRDYRERRTPCQDRSNNEHGKAYDRETVAKTGKIFRAFSHHLKYPTELPCGFGCPAS